MAGQRRDDRPSLPVFVHPSWGGIIPPSPSLASTHPTSFPNYASIPRTLLVTPALSSHLGAASQSLHTVPLVNAGATWTRPRSRAIGQNTPPTFNGSFTSSSPPIFTPNSSVRTSATSQLDEHEQVRRRMAGLDKYAASYIPAWLRSLPDPYETIFLPPKPVFPSEVYPSTVLPPSFFATPRSPISSPSESLLAHPPCDITPFPLVSVRALSDPEYYALHFTSLLSLQLISDVDEMTSSTIYRVPIHAQRNLVGTSTYRLDVPGIREDAPRLFHGDRLLLRGLWPQLQQPATHAIEVEVMGTSKVQGWVYVTAPRLEEVDAALPKTAFSVDVGRKQLDNVRSSEYRVDFRAPSEGICVMQDAVRCFGEALTRPQSQYRRPLAHRWLFPEISDVPPVDPYASAVSLPEDSDLDPRLNQEQYDAVRAIVSEVDSRVPFLISGPPGTGKTKTLVEAVREILRHQPHACILLTAPSNPAADTLALRLSESLSSTDMLRLNAPSRTFAEVPEILLRYCYIQDDQFSIPSYSDFLKYRVVVCSCRDASILVSGRLTNTDMMRAEFEFFNTLHPHGLGHGRTSSVQPHWTHCLIDEAGQASEPEVLVPLSVVLPPDLPNKLGTAEPMVVLCGDINQLGPIIASLPARNAELDVSLMERLFQREVYAKHPMARRNLGALKLLEKIVQESYRAPFCNLVKNYRSIAPILMIPAALFYDDTLEPAATDVSLLSWSALPNPAIPVVFFGSEKDDECVGENTSWYNGHEIDIAVSKIQSLLRERPEIRPAEIAVITPWQEQVWRLRMRLRSVGLAQVDVGNVETYQGREFRVTFLSCVRTRHRFLDGDKRANVGLVNERKRFNVSITRAKELLVVVGSANLLKTDPYWNGFLQIMMRNNLYVGPKIEGLEVTGAYMSRLEATLRFEGNLSDDDAGLTLAGVVARVTLGSEGEQ